MKIKITTFISSTSIGSELYFLQERTIPPKPRGSERF